MHVRATSLPLLLYVSVYCCCTPLTFLQGASVTLVDNLDPSLARMYLFGGRLVSTRRMVNDMYELNLSTLRWTKLFSEEEASSSKAKPRPRYFHSSNVWNGQLIIFGGMGYTQGSDSELCVVNEVVAFDLQKREWDLNFASDANHVVPAGPEGEEEEDFMLPEARYAHLSSITADSLVIIGGQDMANQYVEEINVLNLRTKRWVIRQAFPKQRGSYRSLAVEPLWTVEDGELGGQEVRAGQSASTDPQASLLSPNNIHLLPISSRKSLQDGTPKPLPVYVYTNYNFTDVKREMECMELSVDENQRYNVDVEDRSSHMNGVMLPPGLRFPMGAISGSHLLISGTYLANTSQTFAIWALHLPTMSWSRLDVGPLLSSGSWNRGLLWPTHNRLIVFGHRDRDLVADYNHRQTNWNHILSIELEAWGISQPPVMPMSVRSVEIGLSKLASSTIGSFSTGLESGSGSLENSQEAPPFSFGGRGDFEIVCSDGMRLGCDRVILERRWPWFASKMKEYRRILRKVASSSKYENTKLSVLLEEEQQASHANAQNSALALLKHADPRITPRQLHIDEPSPVMLALLVFLYTRCICIPLQQHPAIIAALLIASKTYEMQDLELWAKHAAHVALTSTLSTPAAPSSQGNASPKSNSLSPLERHRLAVALYEAATMGGFEALQIRSLRTVMSIARWVQRSSAQGSRFPAPSDSPVDEIQPTVFGQDSTGPASRTTSMTSSPHVSRTELAGRGDETVTNRSFKTDRPSLSTTDTDDSTFVSSPRSVSQPSRPPPSSLSRPPPPSISSVKKRFSIFGKNNEHQKSSAGTLEQYDEHGVSLFHSSHSSLEQGVHRVNTNGSGGDDSSAHTRSVSSLQASVGSSMTHSTPTLPHSPRTDSPAFGNTQLANSGKDAKRSENEKSSAGRKVSATLGRFKSSATRSTSHTSSQVSTPPNGIADVNDAQPTPVVIAPPLKLSSARHASSGPYSPTIGSSSKGRSTSEKMSRGQLSDKDLKALQSIWA